MAQGTNCIFSPGKVGFAVCCALLLVARSGAIAAESSSASEAKEDPAYRAAIKDALAEYSARHFEEARILFRRAHELDPNARTLRGIGMASFELRDYVAAVHALSAALVDPRKPLTPEQRTHAQGLLERSRLFVDIYSLKVTPSDARVLIDGRAPDYEPDGTVLLGFGSHNLEVSKPGFVLRTFSVNVRGGERKDLSMTLERKAQLPTRPALADSSDLARKSAPVFPEPRSRSATPWLIGAGVAAVAAVGSAGWLIDRNSELSKTPPQDYYYKNKSTVELERNLAVAGTAVAGAAAVTLALVGVLGSSSSPKATAQVSLSCTPTLGGVVCGKPF